MANDKRFIAKNGLQTQNIALTSANVSSANTITVNMLDSGTLSFSGTSGQLFSITDSMSGTIFGVNDISGVPSIEVFDSGVIRLAQISGNILVGAATDNGNKLNIQGNLYGNGNITVIGSVTASTFTGALTGNASTATTLQTARNINGTAFNGSADITIVDSTKLPLTGGTLTGSLFTRGGFGMQSSTIAGNPIMYDVQDQAGATVIEIGRSDNVAATTAMDIHTGATTVDYDTRLQFSGGNGVSGNGSLNILTGTLQLNGVSLTTISTTQTLTNKTISGSNNILSNIGNASLTNSSLTVGTTAIALGASSTTLAGLTSVTSTSFVGALTGNASTATNVAYTGLTGTVPTWNQNTTGTASNVTGTVAILNGGTGSTTQSGARTNLGLGTIATEATTTYLNKTETYNAGHAPEGKNLANAFLLNDFANARLRGSTFTFTNISLSNAQIDGLFDGVGTYLAFTPGTQTFPVVIEFTLPRTLTFGAFIGLSFGNPSWRSRGVKIETFTEGAWTTQLDTTTNAVADIVVQIGGSAAIGTTAVRYTFTDPFNTSAGAFRILHLWGYNYNSDMWSQAIMPRVGGTFYGGITAPTITGALTGNASTATTLQTARTINGVSFNGSANISITANTTNALTIGTGLSGSSFNGSGPVTVAIDSTVATLAGSQTLTNKTLSSGIITGTLTANGAVGTAGQVLTTSGTGVYWSPVYGNSVLFLFKAADYTAKVNDYIMTDTSAGSFTITLPISPVAGNAVTLYDNASWAVNNLIVARNGSTIEGIADDFALDISSIKVEFIYNGSTWQVYSSVGQNGPGEPAITISDVAALAIALG